MRQSTEISLLTLGIFLTDEMQVNYACVKAALIKAQNADKYELASEYDSAIDCYQSAVELLLPFIEGLL